MSTSNILGIVWTTIPRTPLHNPSSTSIFLSSMIRAPGAKVKACGGIPAGVRKFKNSVGHRTLSWSVAASMESELDYVTCVAESKFCKIFSFHSSATALVGVRIARSQKYRKYSLTMPPDMHRAASAAKFGKMCVAKSSTVQSAGALICSGNLIA